MTKTDRTRLLALEAAARKFIAKVDEGRLAVNKSGETYRDLSAALALADAVKRATKPRKKAK